jgi:hypothetical protein
MNAPAPVNRVYRTKLWHLALAFAILPYGFFSLLTEFRKMPSAEGRFDATDVVLGIISVAIGVYLTIRFFSFRVTFTLDAVEQSNIFNSKRLPYSAIRGRREYVVRGGEDGGETRYLKLEPNDDRFPTLDFMKAYNFDDAFYSWFNQLPDLDEEDKTRPKTSNFGLV